MTVKDNRHSQLKSHRLDIARRRRGSRESRCRRASAKESHQSTNQRSPPARSFIRGHSSGQSFVSLHVLPGTLKSVTEMESFVPVVNSFAREKHTPSRYSVNVCMLNLRAPEATSHT